MVVEKGCCVGGEGEGEGDGDAEGDDWFCIVSLFFVFFSLDWVLGNLSLDHRCVCQFYF